MIFGSPFQPKVFYDISILTSEQSQFYWGAGGGWDRVGQGTNRSYFCMLNLNFQILYEGLSPLKTKHLNVDKYVSSRNKNIYKSRENTHNF